MRKRQQLESLVYHVKRLFPYSDANIDIVEFGCGQGRDYKQLICIEAKSIVGFQSVRSVLQSIASYSDILFISTQTLKLKHRNSNTNLHGEKIKMIKARFKT